MGKKTLFSVPDIVSFLSEPSNSLPDSEKGYIATLEGKRLLKSNRNATVIMTMSSL